MAKLSLALVAIAVYLLPQQSLPALREQLTNALNSSKTTDSLYNQLKKLPEITPVITSYLGTLQALKAKHAWNPYFKIKYLDSAETTFAAAVNSDPHDIEIRFMRFSVEHYVPGFLGYNKNLVTDREEMIAQLRAGNYNKGDKKLIEAVINFLLSSGRCTKPENEYLVKKLKVL